MKKIFAVYILASKKNGVLYTGITNDLIRRINEHKKELIPGFTKKYKVFFLVYYETYEYGLAAIEREKQLKKWQRQWKVDLIEKDNPSWRDLYWDLF